ncbi:MAG: hypothetical protein E5X35_07630 [Mesorhizobium sp.]|uniref:hypothetical protein n=1 Tax=Mesorhizobium sp. TaxID=1871066 RepID=UPI001203B9B9|nr:hypothetical protein [Mesorhizobium sp.]TIR34575.1 MAG: hypothetical protein E5X35_07630 [Mesorhizobium sp.]
MTIKLSSLKADLAREEKGDWMPALDIPGVEFNVSSLHLPAYQTALALMEQRLARSYKGAPVPTTIRTVEVGKLLHKHILHDWRGFDEPYSPELAREMLCEPEGRNFIAAVQNCAAMISLTDVEFVEDAGKNSERPSATS